MSSRDPRAFRSGPRRDPLDYVARNQDQLFARLENGETEFERLLAKGFRREAGPLGIELQSSPTEADQDRARALAPAAIEHCLEQIAEWNATIEAVVWEVEPSVLVAGLITRHCFIQPYAYFEPASTNHPVILEIVAPIVAARPVALPVRRCTARDVFAIEDLYEDVQHLTFLLALAKSFTSPAALEGNASAVTNQWQYVRGSSYSRHARELAQALFFDSPGWPSSLGFSSQECGRFLASFLEAIQDRYNDWGRSQALARAPKNPAARRAHFERVVLPGFADLVSLSREDAEQLLGPTGATAARALLDRLSILRLDGTHRPLFDPNPFWIRPLLELGGRFFAVAPGPMTSELPYLLDGLQQGTPGHAKRRARSVDALALDRLAQVFVGSRTYQGLYYRDLEGGDLCELDGLLMWEDVVIVLEGKSGLISATARRGDAERLRRETQRLVVDARDQCGRVVRLLQRGEDAVFYMKDGTTELLRIGGGDARRVFTITPCFDNLAGVQFDRDLLTDLRAEGAPFLAVFVNDLAVICDMLPNPPLILSYLEWRASEQVHRKVLTQDELDLLGAYMFGGVDMQLATGVDYLHLANSTVDFDDYYLPEGRGPMRDRPRKKLAPQVERFIELADGERPEGWLDSCMAILRLTVSESGALAGILELAAGIVGPAQCYRDQFARIDVLVLGAEVETATLVADLTREDSAVMDDTIRVVAKIETGEARLRVAGPHPWAELCQNSV